MAQNNLSNFSRELPKDLSCEIISKSVHRFSSRSRLKFFSFYSPGGHLFNGAEPFDRFVRSLAKEHFCEIISKSVHRFSRRSCLKLFSIYSRGGYFVQQSGTVLAILMDSHLRNIPV